MSKILIIYHSADFDGKCSAAIAAGAYPDAVFYGWNHYEEINWQLINQYELVIMVDISFPNQQDMERLNSGGDFIWIDHHKTAIDKYGNLGFEGLYEVGKGACQLCWEYFFPHLELPYSVKLLADYDIWNHTDKNTLPFQYGMRYQNIQADDFLIWKRLFKDEDQQFNSIYNDGKICYKFEENQNAYKAKNSFEIEFEGHKCIALNGIGGSLVFESVNGREYDIMTTFSYNGKYWSVSMYNDNGNVNVGEIANKYGGGGHAGAAGFKTSEFPFN